MADTGKIFQAVSKNVNLIIHHLDAKVSSVVVNGKSTPYKIINNNTIEINVFWEKGTSKDIKILF
jgi:hypothetical protein